MTDMDMPLPTLPSMPPELMAYIDGFDGAEYGLVMIAIQRFAAAAAAKERERCAALCDEHASIEGIAQQCAAAIRAGSAKS